MDLSDVSREGLSGDPLIVKADEMDQTGTAISTMDAHHSAGLETVHDPRGNPSPAPAAQSPFKQPSGNPALPIRPGLHRDGSAPPPPSQPPPAAPPQQDSAENPTDSLSLAQLKKLVNEMPKIEQPAYAFEYADSQDLPAEVEEWFDYGESDCTMLLNTRESFEHKWRLYCESTKGPRGEEPNWLDVDDEYRKSFLSGMLSTLDNPATQSRLENLESVAYILCGTWGLTAGLTSLKERAEDASPESSTEPDYRLVQLGWMRRGAQLLKGCKGIKTLFGHLATMMSRES